MWGTRIREGYLFFEKRYPSLAPSQRKFTLQASSSKSCNACRLHFPARGEAALSAAIRLASAPIIRCRSAHLVEVRSNLRLPRHYSMRRAPAMPHSVRSLPPRQRHSRLTTVRRGCCQVATRRDSWRSHVHRTHTAQRVQSFKLQTRNVRGQGAEPLAFSWGSKGAILSRERMAPLSVQRHRRCLSLPRRARETPSPVGQIKKVQLFLKNPLDKWAPRAIMQPTSEELQTYDGEK